MAGAPEPLLRVVVPGGCSGNVDRVSPEPLPSFDDDPRVGRTVLTEAQLTERIAELGRELT